MPICESCRNHRLRRSSAPIDFDHIERGRTPRFVRVKFSPWTEIAKIRELDEMFDEAVHLTEDAAVETFGRDVEVQEAIIHFKDGLVSVPLLTEDEIRDSDVRRLGDALR